MAAMNNQLVRIYRDIEGWDALAKETDQNVRRIMRSIIALDKQIAIASENADQELLEPYEFAVQMAGLRLERQALYNEWVETKGRLQELQSFPQRDLGLQDYLEACHSIDLAMPARDILPTRYEVSALEEIESAIYPQYIVPATGFAAKQMDIWGRLSQSPEFWTGAWYSGFLELEWIRARVDANIVGCPSSVFAFMQNTVDEAVTGILSQIIEDEQLVQSLAIGAFTETVDDGEVVNITRSPLHQGLSSIFSYRKLAGGILRRPVPVLVTCYRPLCRLSLNEILAGLRGSIEVAREIVQSPAVKTFCEMSKVVVVSVIAHLFNRMLIVGTRFGYITTGEAYIFLEISENDARFVSYSLCVPRHDVESDPVTGLHRTAVAQVLAFTLRAFRAKRLPATFYHEAQQRLWTWRVDPDDIVNKMPPLIRKVKRDIVYVPDSWSAFSQWSPLEQRAQRMLWPGFKPRFNEADFNDLGCFKFLSSHRIQPACEPMDQTGEPSNQDGEPSNQDEESIEPAEIPIDYRPFCTPECLLGLERSRALDTACPNFRYHGDRHLGLQELLDGLQDQLDDDVENRNQANHKFLCRSGLYTTLLKVRLASHGYTLLLKGVIPSKVDHLCHEADMYDQLLELQGFCVPVSFGMIETQKKVSSHSFGGFSIFMVFGGFSEEVMPLFQCMAAGMDKQVIVDAAHRTFRLIHGQRVLHFDPEPRNMLYDAKTNRVIIADFERAIYDETEGQQHLNPIVQIEGVHEWRPEREKIPGASFVQERYYVRERIEGFFERGY